MKKVNKSFLKSKTFWFNFISLIVLVANQFGFQDFVPSGQVNELGAIIVAVGNGLLRFISNTQIKIK